MTEPYRPNPEDEWSNRFTRWLELLRREVAANTSAIAALNLLPTGTVDDAALRWDTTAAAWEEVTHLTLGDEAIAFDLDSNNAAAFRMWNNEGGFELRADGGTFSIFDLDGGGVVGDTFATFVGDGAATLNYDNNPSVVTASDGARIRHPTDNTDIVLTLAGADDTTLQQFFTTSINRWSSYTNGMAVSIQADDAGGTARNIFESDPDASFTLYQKGNSLLEGGIAGSGGGMITVVDSESSDRAWVTMKNDVGGSTGGGTITHFSDDHMYIDNRRNSGHMLLRGWSASTVARSMVFCDPDAAVELFYQGIKTFDTRGRGVGVWHNNGDDPAIFLWSNTTVQQAFVGHSVSGYFAVSNNKHGSEVRIVGENNSGTSLNGLRYDPDSGIAFNGQAPVSPPNYTLNTYTTDRNLSSSPGTTELRDVLGTLINDLITNGLLT